MTDSYERDELSPSAFSGKQLNRFMCVFDYYKENFSLRNIQYSLNRSMFGSVVMADACNVLCQC